MDEALRTGFVMWPQHVGVLVVAVDGRHGFKINECVGLFMSQGAATRFVEAMVHEKTCNSIPMHVNEHPTPVHPSDT